MIIIYPHTMPCPVAVFIELVYMDYGIKRSVSTIQ